MKEVRAGSLPTFRDFEPAPAACWHCGQTLDAAKAMNGQQAPSAGDVSLCAYCGEIGIFADERLLREPTDEEMVNVMASAEWPNIHRWQIALKEKGGR